MNGFFLCYIPPPRGLFSSATQVEFYRRAHLLMSRLMGPTFGEPERERERKKKDAAAAATREAEIMKIQGG